MRFLALSPLAAYALLGGIAALIWLLYLVKPRTPRVQVASTLVWRRVLSQALVPKDRWRWILSLLLALAVGLSLALALTKPELRTLGPSQQRIVVIVDNRASMAARTGDGSTRWQHALEGARRVIERAGAGSEVLVLDTTGRAPLSGFLPVARAVEQLRRLPLTAEAGGRLPPLPVGTVLSGAHLFTDGVGMDSAPRQIAVHSVFEPADNIAITGFEARPVPGDPTHYEAFLQIVNAGREQKQITVEISGADGFLLEHKLQLAGAATANQTLDVSRFDQGVLRAQVRSEGDAFDLDDTAYCIVAPHRSRRVLLVTSGNPFLEDALRTLPGVALTVRRPVELASLPAFDAYVFDRYAPREAPPAGALLFRPPATSWVDAKWHSANQSLITGWDESHVLTAGVAWRDVRMESGRVAETERSAALVSTQVAGSATGALVLAGRARARWVAVGFALQDSNFPLQPGFPVFLGTALSWLSETAKTTSANLGRIEVPLADAQVRDSRGHSIPAVATGSGTLFEAPRPGVYVVSSVQQQLTVAANAIDPRIAQINDTRLGPDAVKSQLPGRAYRAFPEPWAWLLAIAFVLLAVEWATFSRRITV